MAEHARHLSESRRGKAPSGDPSGRRCPTCGATYPFDFVVCPRDATSLESEPEEGRDPLVGEILGGAFRITRPIGAGGMGRVYEAEHVRLARRVAVKVMHEQLAGYPEAVARFEREAQAVARVANDHVLEVFDLMRLRDGRPCLVTELLEGEELGDLLDREGRLQVGVAIGIARQVCRGLSVAHAVGVVHRDLKPSNLFLLRREGRGGRPHAHVKILDFGVAKMTDGADLTRTGGVVGTPAYMAPEQARGSARTDARADIYAVGAVLYHMLTGCPPFDDEDPARILARLLSEDPRRPRALEKSIPEGVEALIQRAMARAPEDRPASVEELERLLAAFETGEAEGAAAPASGIASMPTVAVSPEASRAESVSRRARLVRPKALVFALAASLSLGAVVLAAASLAVQTFAGRPPEGLEAKLVAALTGLAAVFVLLATMRVLVSRWRSAPVLERLGEGLGGALVWLFVALGVLGLAGHVAAGSLPGAQGASLEVFRLVNVLLPGLLGGAVVALALRRAARVE